MSNRTEALRRGAILLVALALLPSAARAQNAGHLWSTVATAGELDPGSLDTAEFAGSTAQIKGSAPFSTRVTIRYRIAPVDGLFFLQCKALKVRFRDDGGGDVQAHLKVLEVNTGITSTVVSFDSSSLPAASGFRTELSSCVNHSFDFNRNAYWLEAFITKTSEIASGKPALQAIQITSGPQ